ncbi:hypothetical protein [Streptomyces sp. NBC_01294]|uniref:hypothetical protein n=1 Tax=Streptomyces sp. NBC_01294 TaxID=2903815 RepID=UPI002DD82420|nr:hypothetical protein [Streptomyces sp. NBC_01294]WRZ59215.1 hypothetical protein OG534_23670 [Streptomyces sp. NBC_01294]
MDGILSVDLPENFRYPEVFVRAAEAGLLSLDPWWALSEDLIKLRSEQLAGQFPQLRLLPFARRQDNDDVACWDLDKPGILVIDSFGVPGTEVVEKFTDIGGWLRKALDDFIEYEE